MSSSSYLLQGEARWAREKAIESDTEASNWSDPTWVERERRRCRLVAQRARIELEIAEAAVAACDTPEKEVDRAERERDQWISLAVGYEDRLAQAEELTLDGMS